MGETSDLDADRKALARCYECFDDEDDTDVGRPALDRLVKLGWLDKVARNRWEITAEGDAILLEMSIP